MENYRRNRIDEFSSGPRGQPEAAQQAFTIGRDTSTRLRLPEHENEANKRMFGSEKAVCLVALCASASGVFLLSSSALRIGVNSSRPVTVLLE